MIASVISAATLTPTSNTDHSKPASPRPASTFSSHGRARWPVRKRMRSAMRGKLARAPRQGLFELAQRFDHLRRLERLQPLGIFQVDAARIDLDHALRRLGFELRRGVAGEDDGRDAALAGLREDVGGKIVGNAVDAFRYWFRGCRDKQPWMDTEINEYA